MLCAVFADAGANFAEAVGGLCADEVMGVDRVPAIESF